MGQITIPEFIEPIIQSYYENNAKKLRETVDKILFKLHFIDVDKDDFYSLADEVFMYTIRDYDPSKSFDGFLYSCLYKKFCSEMTRRLRDKRCIKIKILEEGKEGGILEKIVVIPDISLYTPLGDDSNSTIEDIIADNKTIEDELFGDEEAYSKKMLLYLSRLSSIQKDVLKLNIAGYLPNEIREELHLTEKQYADCDAAIHSYRNVSLLF